MNKINEITSMQNPLVKELVSLQRKSSQREKTASFLIEGIRELEKAIKSGYKIHKLIINSDALVQLDLLNNLNESCELFKMDKNVFSKFAYRDRVENVVAIAETKSHNIEALELPDNPLIVILETIEKPGNIGAIMRTCDAAGVDALIVCDPKTDLYNPNVVRSSLGCLFTNQVVVCASDAAISFLKTNNIQIFVSHLEAAENIYKQDYKHACALVLGSEAFGVTNQWIEVADNRIKIPMRGEVDSMNVSNAAAVMIYEVVRQRSA